MEKYHKKKITATETKMIIDVMIAIHVLLSPVSDFGGRKVVVVGFVS